MSLRVLTLTTAAVGCVATGLAVATAAWALQGDPIPGADVSAEQSPGGIRVMSGATNAEGHVPWRTPTPGTYLISISGGPAIAACKRAVAEAPSREPGRRGRGIVVARGGGAFSAATGAADGPGVVVTVTNATGRVIGAQWANCDALSAGGLRASVKLAPVVVGRGDVSGPITIGVGYVRAPRG